MTQREQVIKHFVEKLFEASKESKEYGWTDMYSVYRGKRINLFERHPAPSLGAAKEYLTRIMYLREKQILADLAHKHSTTPQLRTANLFCPE